jgi:hypothetical protein
MFIDARQIGMLGGVRIEERTPVLRSHQVVAFCPKKYFGKGVVMKKVSVLLAFLLVFGVVFAASQPVNGKRFELSMGLSFDAYSYHSPYDPAGYSNTDSYINLPIRFGWYIWKGLEFEPELMLTKYREHEIYPPSEDYKYSETGWMLSGNLLYNFRINNSHFMPFILAGFGFGNGVP